MSKILKRNNLTKFITAFILGLTFLLLAAPDFVVGVVAADETVSVSGNTVRLTSEITLDNSETWTINKPGVTNALPTGVKVSSPSNGSLPRTISIIDLNGNNLIIKVGSGDSSLDQSFDPANCGLNIAGGNVTIQNTGSPSAQIQVQGKKEIMVLTVLQPVELYVQVELLRFLA